MRYIHIPIYQKTYILTLDIYRITSKFTKEYKYSLGGKMKDISHELLDLIVFINSQSNKLEAMEKLKYKIETLRIFLRLAFDMKILGQKNLESTNRKIEEICIQIVGWQKWAANQK